MPPPTAEAAPDPEDEESATRSRPRIRTRPHPVGTPGTYRAPARLQRFLLVRAPRCEWPGCGARASLCDNDHDVAFPGDPTCACNVGPLCRRHHRIKQPGWHKERTRDGVLWTTPTGRQVLAPHQSLDVPDLRSPQPARPSPLDQLSPLAREHELWTSDPTDPRFDGLETDASGLAAMRFAERAAEEHWWVRELADLRRQAFATPHA